MEQVHAHVLMASAHRPTLRPLLKDLQRLMGTTCDLQNRREGGLKERRWVGAGPSHRRRYRRVLRIPHEEMYGEYFDIPEPETSSLSVGSRAARSSCSGCCYRHQPRRIFISAPATATYPTYHQPEVLRVISNARCVGHARSALRLPSASARSRWRNCPSTNSVHGRVSSGNDSCHPAVLNRPSNRPLSERSATMFGSFAGVVPAVVLLGLAALFDPLLLEPQASPCPAPPAAVARRRTAQLRRAAHAHAGRRLGRFSHRRAAGDPGATARTRPRRSSQRHLVQQARRCIRPTCAAKVVMVEFWTYGCINCQHVIPALQDWHAACADDGLVVINVQYARIPATGDPANVEARRWRSTA